MRYHLKTGSSKVSKFKFYLGISLITASIGLGVFTYYPLFVTFKSNAQVSGPFTISIPKINARARIISGIDPWNEASYQPALKLGVAEARGSSSPYQGTIFLFAHSSGLPWEMTRENTPFLRLGELNKGDQIVLTKDGKDFSYIVEDKKEVWPSEVSYLNLTNNNQLILQTCTPIGTDLKRLLIYASPV